jgi:putative NIF3 family GTP cyclohydrolase 1 type 2
VQLEKPVAMSTLVERVKKHLKLKAVRVALAERHRRGRVQRIALCAGAGGSVLAGRTADVYLTGEMRHHDVLAANAAGASVILCDHTNTERPYLPVLKRRLARALKGVKIDISKADREPLEIR